MNVLTFMIYISQLDSHTTYKKVTTYTKKSQHIQFSTFSGNKKAGVLPAFHVYERRSDITSLIAVLCWPSISTSMNAGAITKSLPAGAQYPLAIVTALIAWLSAPAPIAWISTYPFSLSDHVSAPATAAGFDLLAVLNISYPILPFPLLFLHPKLTFV